MAITDLMVAASIGMNVHLPPADTLDLARELGVGWVRIDFDWPVAEPTQGNRDWSVFDRVIGDANARGLKVFATIGYTPEWASVSADREGDGPRNDVPDAAAYRDFVLAAASRYADGRVAAWGTWNEPNLTEFFEGTETEWIDHAFTPAVESIRQGCPACLVVGPELATIGDDHEAYLRAALTAKGGDLDAVSWHIYSPFPQDDIGAGTSRDSFYNELEDHRVVDVGGTVVYEGPLSVREVLLEVGLASIPVWITETGLNAAVDDQEGLEAQALYARRVLDAMSQRPWWEKTFFYELVEEHPNGMWPDIHWGVALRTSGPDGTHADNFDRKPAFDAICDWAPPMGAGGSGGSAGQSGAGGSGGTMSAGGAGAAGSGAGAAGAAGSAPSSAEDDSAGGCGCRAVRKTPDAPVSVGVLVAVLAAFWRRARRGRIAAGESVDGKRRTRRPAAPGRAKT